MRLISAVSGVRLPAPPPLFSAEMNEGRGAVLLMLNGLFRLTGGRDQRPHDAAAKK